MNIYFWTLLIVVIQTIPINALFCYQCDKNKVNCTRPEVTFVKSSDYVCYNITENNVTLKMDSGPEDEHKSVVKTIPGCGRNSQNQVVCACRDILCNSKSAQTPIPGVLRCYACNNEQGLDCTEPPKIYCPESRNDGCMTLWEERGNIVKQCVGKNDFKRAGIRLNNCDEVNLGYMCACSTDLCNTDLENPSPRFNSGNSMLSSFLIVSVTILIHFDF